MRGRLWQNPHVRVRSSVPPGNQSALAPRASRAQFRAPLAAWDWGPPSLAAQQGVWALLTWPRAKGATMALRRTSDARNRRTPPPRQRVPTGLGPRRYHGPAATRLRASGTAAQPGSWFAGRSKIAVVAPFPATPRSIGDAIRRLSGLRDSRRGSARGRAVR